MGARVWRWMLLGMLLGWPQAADAQVDAPQQGEAAKVPRRGYTLRQCLQLAEQNYATVAEARQRVARARAQLQEARTAPFSDFSSTAGVALAPTVRGTNIFSPNTDVALSDNMALAWQVGIQGTVPLWTFGKVSNLVDAASAQVKVTQHEVEQVKNEVRLSVRRAYYGVLFAREAATLVAEALRRIDKHLGPLEQAVEAADADEVSLFKLKMHRAELQARQSEAAKQEAVALAGLRFLLGVRGPLELQADALPEPRRRLASLPRYLAAARNHRPEVGMVRAGVAARQAQVRVQEAHYYPDFGLRLEGGWAQAPEITDQVNPFVRDPGNYLRYGLALGLKWKLDFIPQMARVDQAQAQLEEMRATERFALGGIAVEVEKAYLEARDAENRLDAYAEAAQLARRWLVTVQQGIDVGVYDDSDLVQPAKEYALKRFHEIQATFDYQMALAQLALATGWHAVAPVD